MVNICIYLLRRENEIEYYCINYEYLLCEQDLQRNASCIVGESTAVRIGDAQVFGSRTSVLRWWLSPKNVRKTVKKGKEIGGNSSCKRQKSII